jgi:predicted enzyme related to lactoylglutathione lyase
MTSRSRPSSQRVEPAPVRYRPSALSTIGQASAAITTIRRMAAGEFIWQQSAGPTVFAPFKPDTDYFARDKQWMLNLRVAGLDELLAKLRAAGIDITIKAEWNTPETGRFARIHDPDGNPIELWEPRE